MERLLQGSLAVGGPLKQQDPSKLSILQEHIHQEAIVHPCLLDLRRANKKRVLTNRSRRWRAKKEKRKIDGAHCKAQEEEDILTVSSTNFHKFQDSTDVAVHLVASLKACAKQKDLRRGAKLHIDIIRRGLLKSNVFVGTALVNLYAKCGVLEK
eukprot:c1792_g1_i1 orf=1-459(-)